MGEPPPHGGVPIVATEAVAPEALPPSAAGPSPGPTRTFKGEFLSGLNIPPDTMGAVGLAHVVNATNDRIRIQDRNGAEISRLTLNSFFSGVVLEGGATPTTFDPKVYFDRFNDRYFMFVTANAAQLSSATIIAVSQTSDPTGLWNRFAIDADAAATAASGKWADYPSVGFNKNWIVVQINLFNYSGGSTTGYAGPAIYVFDKPAAYAGTLGAVSTFTDSAANCTAPVEAKLACGFTMVPAITEDNTTNTLYLLENWDATAGQLRLSKLTGTAALPVLTVGTQFPQSVHSWRFNAARIGTTGGYAPQRQQVAFTPSGIRIMTNDSRIQNAVLRNGSLWTTHTVMVAATPTLAGTGFDTTNPDTHSAVQWWQIDPTIETGLSAPPLQRARIEDPSADNCHNGAAGTRTTGSCVSTATQVGEFFAFPNISVNQNNDVLIGYTKFSPLTYPSAGYSMRLASDAANTMRDQVVFRPGQANYNIGSGSGTARQNRWGDYSAAQTDPLNDIDFWTVQEYAGTVRDFGIGLAGNWETWWALVKPGTEVPSPSGTLVISEFRLRGPQGVNDEFVELYNPGTAPVVVTTTDGSDGWALAYSTTAGAVSSVAVIPNGTVIPPKGHFLIARNPDSANGPTVTYSLNGYPGKTDPSTLVRGADSDTGYSLDLADNGGLALFKTATAANFSAVTRMDSVGFAGVPAGLFKEGAGIPAVAPGAIQHAFTRKRPGGCTGSAGGGNCTSVALVETTPAPTSTHLQDTGDNAADFVLVDTAGTSTTAGQRLGAPGPENLDGPIVIDGATLTASTLDACAPAGGSPNLIRDTTPDAPNNSTFGTIDLRRTFTNSTGGAVTRLRFRIVDITTLPALAGVADLRARGSADVDVTVDRPPCGTGTTLVPVRGTTLEQPPAQAMAGGFTASLSVPAITPATPLPSGAALDVRFLLGVQQQGAARFCAVAETLPASASQPFCFIGNTENSPPTATGVAISGTPRVGQTLTGSYTYGDVDGDAQGTSTFRWLRGGSAIGGATGTTYVAAVADLGASITFEVTPVAATGASPGSAATSAGVTIVAPPSISKNFAPDPIAAGGTSTLTFTITNPNTGTGLTGVAFSDTFPTTPGAMVVANPTGATASAGCGAPTFAPTAGAGSVSFNGGAIPASGTCTVTVNVTALTGGTYSNTSGSVSSTNGGTGNTASDSLTVIAPPTVLVPTLGTTGLLLTMLGLAVAAAIKIRRLQTR